MSSNSPETARSRGLTLALVGADGSGKTSVARLLETQLPDLRYVYMGVNPEASNLMLPTTRAWFGLKTLLGKKTHQGGPPSLELKKLTVMQQLKSLLRLALIVPEEFYRGSVVERMRRSGKTVILDRDYFTDFFFHDIEPPENQPVALARKLHGWYLRNCYRKPDMIVFLNAPAKVLYARKQEGSIEELEQRQSDYRRLQKRFENFTEVDARQSLQAVAEQVATLIASRRQRLL